MGFKGALLAFGRTTGAWRLPGIPYGPHRLTVLAYHRVAGAEAAGFLGNVSATHLEFAAQVDWLTAHMTPVSLDDVVAAIDGGPLPRRPVLVTFDDGYRDNLTDALPVLEGRAIRPVVFLATDHIDTGAPFWWDRAADAFAASPEREADLPLLGVRRWEEPRQVARDWIAAAKEVPDREMREHLDHLERRLGVEPSPGPALLSWDDVAAMGRRGVAFGAHTRRHAILTRIDRDDARAEIGGSVDRVREATGSAPAGFAYPNGRARDLDSAVETMVGATGVRAAFTLVPGPARVSEMRRHPLRIRRVYVHHGDGLDRFVAKVAGVPRLVRVPL